MFGWGRRKQVEKEIAARSAAQEQEQMISSSKASGLKEMKRKREALEQRMNETLGAILNRGGNVDT